MSSPQTPASVTSPGAPFFPLEADRPASADSPHRYPSNHSEAGYESDRDHPTLPRVASSIMAHSSTATLCHDEDDFAHYHHHNHNLSHTRPLSHHTNSHLPPTIPEMPAAAPASAPTTAPASAPSRPTGPNPPAHQARAPPVLGVDIISVLDPASSGGGGPLIRITTQQRERQEAEAQERARREALEASGEGDKQEGGSGGILKRFRSSSIRRPINILEPLKSGVEFGKDRQKASAAPLLSPALSHKTLAYTPMEKEGYEFSSPNPLSPHKLSEPERDAPKTGSDTSADGNTCQECDLERQRTAQAEEEEYVYPDGGYGWVVLVCCTTLAGMAMGWGTTWGFIYDYLSRNDYKDANQTLLSTVGPFSAFFSNGCAFLFGRLGDRYGFKVILWVSTITFWFATFISAFTTQLWQLILSYGVLLGIAQGMAIPLFMSLPSQWFYKRRGMASGIAIGGAGIGGGIAAQIIQPLLSRFGFKWTLIILSFINLFFYALATLLIRTRPTSPEARSGGKGPWIDTVVVRKSTFWALAASLLLSVSAYGLPWNYVPLWCSTNLPYLSPSLKAVPSTALCFSLVVGRALIGILADAIGPLNTYILVFILSGIVQYALWLTATSFAGIIAFVIVYGLIAPGYIGILPQIVVQLFGPDNLATNVGLVLLFNCPGNFINGPMGSALFEMTGRTTFKWVVIVGGALQIAGGIVALWARFKTSRRLLARV